MQLVPVFIAFFVALAGRGEYKVKKRLISSVQLRLIVDPVCALDIKLRVGNQSSIPASQFLVFDDNDLTTKVCFVSVTPESPYRNRRLFHSAPTTVALASTQST